MSGMLLDKAWRESRGRFALSVAVVGGLCLLFVVFQAELRAKMGPNGPATYIGYIHLRIYASVVRVIFLILALLLGLGGLAREREVGTLGFTFALPVGRRAHIAARAAVGLGQVLALAWLPALLVPTTSLLVGERYPWGQAAELALLWSAGGALVLAVGLVVSSALRSSLIALTVGVLTLELYPFVVARTGLALQLGPLMSGRGMAYFDPRTAELVGAVPWSVVVAITAVALALFAVAAGLTSRQGWS